MACRVHGGRELIECLPASLVPEALEVQQILESHSAVGSDFMKRELLILQKIHQVLPGYTQVVSCGLSCEVFILWNENDGPPLRKDPNNAGKMGDERVGQFDVTTVGIDQANLAWLGEGFGESSKMLLRNERGIDAVALVGEHVREVTTCASALKC